MFNRITVHLRNQWAGLLALFLVLAGGTAYAANTVFSDDIVNGEVKQQDIAAQAVGTDQVKNNQINTGDIATAGVGSLEVLDEDLGASDIAAGGVGSSEILDEALGSSDIGPDAIGTSEVADGALGSADLGTNSVGADEIASNSVGPQDVDEGNLDGLPVEMAQSAGTSGGCNPTSTAFVTCKTTNTISTVGPTANVLVAVIASLDWHSDGVGGAAGVCNLRANTPTGPTGIADIAIVGEANDTTNSSHRHTSTLLGFVSAPDATSYFVECNETDADFVVDDADVVAFGSLNDPTR